MSNTIEERELSLRFNNQQFEKATKESMSTLKRFNESLRTFKDDTQDVMAPVVDGAVQVTEKFNVMNKVLGRVAEKLTDSVYAFGTNMIKQANQMGAGMKKYESIMNSTRTLMNSTGKSLKEVEEVYQDLVTYSDQTSYSLETMSSSMATIISTGAIKDMKQAERALEGIANAAAHAGIGVRQAARPIETITQAFSEGSMSRIRWNSLQGANFTTPQLMEQFFKAAQELGKMDKQGNILTKSGKKMKVTMQNFESTLQHGWLTSEVMAKAFEGYVDGAGDLGKAAYKAAQEAKSFTDVMDTLKDVMSTGWAKSFEYIFGNVNQAASFFTWMANEFSEVLGSVGAFRNEVLKGWNEGGGRSSMVRTIKTIWETLKKIGGIGSQAFKNVFGTFDAQKLLNVTSAIEKKVSDIFYWLGGDADKSANGIAPRFVLIRQTIEGVASAFSFLWDIVKGVFGFLGNVFGSVFGDFDDVLMTLAGIGRNITDVVNKAKKLGVVPMYFNLLFRSIKPIAPYLAAILGYMSFKRGGIGDVVTRILRLNPAGHLSKGLSKITKIGGIVVALVGAFKLLNGVLRALTGKQDIIGQLAGVWNIVMTFFLNLQANALAWLNTAIESVETWFANLKTNVSSWLGGVLESVRGWFAKLKSNLSGWLDAAWRFILYDVADFFQRIFGYARNLVVNFGDRIASVFETVKNTVVGFFEQLGRDLPRYWVAIRNGARNLFALVVNTVGGAIMEYGPRILEAIKHFFLYDVGDAILNTWAFLRNKVVALGDFLAAAWEDVKAKVVPFATGLWTDVRDWVVTNAPVIWADVKNAVVGFGDSVIAGAREVLPKVGGALSGFAESILMLLFGGTTASAEDGRFTEEFSDFANAMIGGGPIASEVASTVEENIQNGGLFEALKNAVTSAWNSVVETVRPIFESISGFFRDMWDITVAGVSMAWEWAKGKLIPILDVVIPWIKGKFEAIRDMFITSEGQSSTVDLTGFANKILNILPVILAMGMFYKVIQAFSNIKTGKLVIFATTMVAFGVSFDMISASLKALQIDFTPIIGFFDHFGSGLEKLIEIIRTHRILITIGLVSVALIAVATGFKKIGKGLKKIGKSIQKTFASGHNSLFSGNSLIDAHTNMGTNNKFNNGSQWVESLRSKLIGFSILIAAVGAMAMAVMHSFKTFTSLNLKPEELEHNAIVFGALVGGIILLTGIMGGVFAAISKKDASGQFADKMLAFSAAVLSISTLIVMIVFLFKEINNLPLDDEKAIEDASIKGAIALGAIIVLTGLVAIATRLSAGKNGVSSATIAGVVGMVLGVVAILTGIYFLFKFLLGEKGQAVLEAAKAHWVEGLVAVGAVIGTLLVLSKAIGAISGATVSPGGILALGLTLLSTILIINKIVSVIKTSGYGVALVAIGGIVATLAALAGALYVITKNVPEKKTLAMIALFGGLAIVIGKLKSIMNTAKNMTVAKLAALFGGIAVVMVSVSEILKAIGGEKVNSARIAVMAAGMVAIIYMLEELLLVGEKLSMDKMITIFAGVSVVLLSLSRVMKNAQGVKAAGAVAVSAAILGLAGVFVAIGYAISLINESDLNTLLALLGGVTLNLLAVGRMINHAHGMNLAGIFTVLTAFVGLGAVFIALGFAVNQITDPNAWQTIAAITLGISVDVLAVSHLIKSTEGVSAEKLGISIGLLLALGLVMVCFSAVLAKIPANADWVLIATITLGIAVDMVALGYLIKKSEGITWKQVGLVTLLLFGTAAIFGALGVVMSNLVGQDDAITIAAITVGISAIMIALGYLVKQTKDISFGGILAVSIMLGLLSVIFLVFSTVVEKAVGLDWKTTLSLTGGLALCLGAMALMIKASKDVTAWQLLGIALMMGGFAAILFGLAAALDAAKGITWSEAGIVYSGAIGAVAALVLLGYICSSFQGVGPAALKGATYLIGVLAIIIVGAGLIALAVAAIGTVIAQMGSGMMEEFSSALWLLGEKLQEFQQLTESLTEEDTKRVKGIVEILGTMMTNIPKDTGNVRSFSTNLNSLGSRMHDFYQELGSIDRGLLQERLAVVDDIKSTAEKAAGIKGIPDLTQSITNLGGAIGLYYGNLNKISFTDKDGNPIDESKINTAGIAAMFAKIVEDMPEDEDLQAVSKFADDSQGSQLNLFAIGVQNLALALDTYRLSLSGIKQADIEKSNTILGAFSSIAQAMPETWELNTVVGTLKISRETLDQFSSDIELLGEGLAKMATDVGGALTVIDDKGTTNMDVAIQMAQGLTKIQNALPRSFGALSIFFGRKSLGDFASNLGSLGTGISNFIKNSTKDGDGLISDEAVKSAENVAKVVAILAGANADVGSNYTSFISGLTGTTDWEIFLKNMTGIAEGIIGFTKVINADENKGIAYASEEMAGALASIGSLATSMRGVDDAMLTNIAEAIPAVGTALVDMVTKIVGMTANGNAAAFSQALTAIESFGKILSSQLVENFTNGLLTTSDDGEIRPNGVLGLVNVVNSAVQQFIQRLATDSLSEEDQTLLSETSMAIGAVIAQAVCKGIADGAELGVQPGGYLLSAAGKITQGLDGLLRTTLQTEGGEGSKKFAWFGRQIDIGLANGIAEKQAAPINNMAMLIRAMIDRARAEAKVYSPSRVMMEFGGFLDQGLAIGVEENGDIVEKAGEDIGSWIPESIKEGVDQKSGSLFEALTDMSAGAEEAVRDRLDIHSLSDIFAGIGNWIPLSVGEGVEGGKGGLLETIGSIFGDLPGTITSILSGDWTSVLGAVLGEDLANGMMSALNGDWSAVLTAALGEELAGDLLALTGNTDWEITMSSITGDNGEQTVEEAVGNGASEGLTMAADEFSSDMEGTANSLGDELTRSADEAAASLEGGANAAAEEMNQSGNKLQEIFSSLKLDTLFGGEGTITERIGNFMEQFDFKNLLGDELGTKVNSAVEQLAPILDNLDFKNLDAESIAGSLGKIDWEGIFGKDSKIAESLKGIKWDEVVGKDAGETFKNLLGQLNWGSIFGIGDFVEGTSLDDLLDYNNWNLNGIGDEEAVTEAVANGTEQGILGSGTTGSSTGTGKGGKGGSGKSTDESGMLGKQTTTVSSGGLVLSATEGYTIGDILNRIDRLETAITHMQVVLDSGVLVGQMDQALGNSATLEGRWN